MGSVGLVPISMVVAGAAVQVSLDGMLIVAGVGMAVVCMTSLLSPAVRHMGLEPTFEAAPANARSEPGSSEAAQIPA